MAKKSQSVPAPSISSSPGTRQFSSASEDLEKAKARLTLLTEDPGNDVKLKLYALYKQVRKHLLRSIFSSHACKCDYRHGWP